MKTKNISFFAVTAFCFSLYKQLSQILFGDLIIYYPITMISNPFQEVLSYTSMRLVSAESTSPSSSRITPLSATVTHPAENYFYYDSGHNDRRSIDSYLSHSVTVLLPHALLLLNLL